MHAMHSVHDTLTELQAYGPRVQEPTPAKQKQAHAGHFPEHASEMKWNEMESFRGLPITIRTIDFTLMLRSTSV